MNTQLAAVEVSSPALLSPEKVELLKRTICKGATDDELELFLAICNKRHLDPFTKQIYAVKRWDSSVEKMVMAAQTSIDGLRVIAERTGKYDGQDAPLWCGKDGVWVDAWLKEEPPAAAKVMVYRKDHSRGSCGIAYFKEAVQTKKGGEVTQFWKKMPALMLAKCAEALAIRKAFPDETSGLYVPEEMPPTHEDENEKQTDKQTVVAESAPPPSIRQLSEGLSKTEKPKEPALVEVQGRKNDKLEYRQMLADTELQVGRFKGSRLGNLPVNDLKVWLTQIRQSLLDPSFPKSKVDEAKGLIEVIEAYLGTFA